MANYLRCTGNEGSSNASCSELRSCVDRYWSQFRTIVIAAVIVALAATGYYFYLARLYLMDEVHSVDRLRELTMDEKFTIRVVAPKESSALHDFVLHFSICPSVHEIQVIWHSSGPPPRLEDFKFSTTHSKLSFHGMSSAEAVFQSYFHPSIETKSLLMLDADVFVSCQDLAFTQSVWRSSQVSVVGYFPRALLEDKDDKGRKKFIYRSPGAVIWSQEYALLLSAGLMLNAEYLKTLSLSTDLSSFLRTHPQCADFVLPLWARSQGALAPIWAEVAPWTSDVQLVDYPRFQRTKRSLDSLPATSDKVNASILPSPMGSSAASQARSAGGASGRGFSIPHKSMLTNEERSECITDIARILSIQSFPASHTKSCQAKNSLIW